MEFKETELAGACIIEPQPFEDNRGWFARVYCEHEFSDFGFNGRFVQINHSFNTHRGTVRGMHFQVAPHTESKLIRCISGSVYDVIVDLRKGSPTFLQWIGVELSAANKKLIFVPNGFAHGFQTLQDSSELIYHHTEFYEPTASSGVGYYDKRIRVQWPIEVSMISEKDKGYEPLSDEFEGIEP
jgi:dTDP-4-dehydrorhamnose 3,5-epimerase